jgi:hypothetical protein
MKIRSSILALAAAVAGLQASLAAAAPAPEYGITQPTYVQIPAAAFVPMDSTTSYSTTSNGFSGQVLRVGTVNAAFQYFSAPVNVPSGALLKSLALDACDDTTSNGYVQSSLVVSDRFGNVVSNSPFVLSDGTGCKTFDQDLTGMNITVDNNAHHYWVVALVSHADGFNVGLAGMVVGYQLQVSQHVGSPTFADVPANNIFYQYVEALAASGITGGCGGGNFCPDSPVTRAQMATFLAKALGLAFN